jgi:5'-nucleotidase
MTTNVEELVPYPRRIFCNRNLRLDSVRYIGFDMDYTLALYTEEMEFLQAEMVKQRMVDVAGYDEAILDLTYDPKFAIRGLAVDLAHGNVFKMDRHRFVGRTWHGNGPLDPEERRDTYTNRKISPDDPNISLVDTLFSLPEISLYCQLVAFFDERVGKEEMDYSKLWADLRGAMDSLHRDGSLKSKIESDLASYIMKDPELAEMLHRFRSAGKKLFLLTNSEATYTEKVMSFLFDEEHDGYGSWRDYFDCIMTLARKPLFFTGDEPFVEIGDDLQPMEGDVTALRRGRLYQGGNVKELNRLTGMQGEDVLYVGDHIYGDILRSKRHAYWRTAMVVQEMEREMESVLSHSDELDRIARLEQERFQLSLERAARALEGERDKALRDRIRSLSKEIAGLEKGTSALFNPNWGMLFRDRAELSAFGAQVENYACIYTSRASNFRLYSPVWYFRSPRDRMAHELQRP